MIKNNFFKIVIQTDSKKNYDIMVDFIEREFIKKGKSDIKVRYYKGMGLYYQIFFDKIDYNSLDFFFHYFNYVME